MLSRISKKLIEHVSWYSRMLQISCKKLTIGCDHARLGYVGGETVDQDISMLDPILGSWRQLGYENFEAFLDALGVTPERKAVIMNIKTNIKYSRNGEVWKLEIQHQGSPDVYPIKFELDGDFMTMFFTGHPVKSVIYQDGSLLRERHEFLEGPSGVMTMMHKVDGDSLVTTIRLKGVVAKKIYERA